MPATPEIMITCGCTAAPITPATSPKFAVNPSLKPYTTLRRKPPDPVLCHGSAPLPAEPRPQLGVQGRPRVIDRVAVLAEELAPHLHVALFDAGELDVDVLAMRI